MVLSFCGLPTKILQRHGKRLDESGKKKEPQYTAAPCSQPGGGEPREHGNTYGKGKTLYNRKKMQIELVFFCGC